MKHAAHDVSYRQLCSCSTRLLTPRHLFGPTAWWQAMHVLAHIIDKSMRHGSPNAILFQYNETRQKLFMTGRPPQHELATRQVLAQVRTQLECVTVSGIPIGLAAWSWAPKLASSSSRAWDVEWPLRVTTVRMSSAVAFAQASGPSSCKHGSILQLLMVCVIAKPALHQSNNKWL